MTVLTMVDVGSESEATSAVKVPKGDAPTIFGPPVAERELSAWRAKATESLAEFGGCTDRQWKLGVVDQFEFRTSSRQG